MNQKVKFFASEHAFELRDEINEFAKKHHIENVSYSTCVSGYNIRHYCCVLYSDK